MCESHSSGQSNNLNKVLTQRARGTDGMVNGGWGKIVRGLRQGLSEDERYAVADHVVEQLKERGDAWGLDDEAKPTRGSST